MESWIVPGHSGRIHRSVLHCRHGPLGPSVLLRLHGAAVWLDPRAGHFWKRSEQIGGGTVVRILRRMDGGPRWAATAHAGGNFDGACGPDWPGEHPEARNAFTTVPFFLLTLGSMFSIAAVSGAQQNLKLFLSLDLHFAQGQAARILSLVLAFSIAGRLLMGWLADRFPKKYVMVLIYILVAAAIPLLFAGRAPAAIYIFAAVFGIGLGGDYMIVPLMTAEIFGVQLLGRLLGVILTAGSVAEAVSPWLVGRLRDTTGSYSAGFLVLVALGLLGAASAAMLPRGKQSA